MLRIVLDTLLPPQADPKLTKGIFDAGFDDFYPEFQRTSNATLRNGFKLAVFTAAWIAPLLAGRVPPISLYSRPTRERILEAMETSRFYFLRQMMVALKTVAALCYGGNRQVRAAMGYPKEK